MHQSDQFLRDSKGNKCPDKQDLIPTSQFKKIVLCFDYDKDSKTGQKWSLENSRVHNVPFINLAETVHLFNHEIYKDFCEMHKSIYLTTPRKFTKIGEYLLSYEYKF